ncbi:glycoside hydrolase family 65 [Paenibacillus sp. S-38]|uniref:glycoside hydrolase family 65 n=1 Tax=Paenibacillus sp. S-38 TaxID=3416710 RepID=UPI003CE68499
MSIIDRKALVGRHNPVIREVVPLSPLSVGNGEFAFTADLTGLQTFPEAYEVPLGTQSQWGWHSTGGREVWTLDDVRLQYRDEATGLGGYPVHAEDREEAYHWLRQNPHRLQLGQLGLLLLQENGGRMTPEDITDAEQTLDLWTGVLTSRFRADGVPVAVQTVCHPELDGIGVTVESPLLAEGRLGLSLRFPAPGVTSQAWDKTTGLHWGGPEEHRSELERLSGGSFLIRRTMDVDGYGALLRLSEGELAREEEPHAYAVRGVIPGGRLELTLSFAPQDRQPPELAGVIGTLEASRRHWERFWQEGAAVELADSRDPRALELERRIVLSQFLTAIHSAGSVPPQETGLLYNSWFGKPHLEMHWWHAVHFPLWGRTELLLRSMDWYREILPKAKALAASQGYTGARWPKMVGPEGNQSPSPIAALLIWQQPHPIVFAELAYQADPTAETLERFADIVLESAEFMASFAAWDEAEGLYVLGPPVIPAQENHKPAGCRNPAYELEYWHHGLETAIRWAERIGRPVPDRWQRVCRHLAALPEKDGVYLAHERCPDTYTAFNTDHPSMLGALGLLPGRLVKPDVMRATLGRVLESWRWETSWGWDFPMAAMTAARLGEGALAVDLLLKEEVKNTYLPSGHNYQRPGLTAYLPGNGGLLAAVALMAGGWQGGPEGHAPGFPQDGSWTVRAEGLNPWL